MLAGLLVLEVLLRLGALAVHLVPSRAATAVDSGRRQRLLAIGDSNTWGLWVEAEDAYPKQVEFLWNQDPGRLPLEVVNLGYPGMNSSGVLKRLPQFLRMLRPDIVTVMIGVNDYWTAPEDAEGDWWTRVDSRLWQWSRLYRAAAMVGRGLVVPEVVAPRDGFGRPAGPLTLGVGGETIDMPKYRVEQVRGWFQRLETNLEAIVEVVRRSGARLVFLTYPSGAPLSSVYGEANRALRESAAKLDVPLVEIAPRMTPRCPETPCKELLKDNHPTKRGHRRAARIIVEALRAALGDTRSDAAPPA